MKKQIGGKKIIGFLGYISSFIANADTEVIKKHPYVLRDLVNLALLMTGMTTLIFALQYMALASYTGNQEFGIIAACLSAGIIFMLDRIVVGGDYDLEGEILYLKETNADNKRIQKLNLKRACGMGWRVALGVSIAYAAVTLSMPKVLNFEIEGYFNKKELDLNREANQQLQAAYDGRHRLIDEKHLVLEGLEVELAAVRGQQEVTRRTLFGDIRKLQEKRENRESNALFAKNCANAELSGRVSEGCNSSGKKGEGDNYFYWQEQAKLHEAQVEKYSQLIAEKQQQIEQLPEALGQEPIKQRMAKVRQEIGELDSAIKHKLEEAKDHQLLAGSRQTVVRQGLIARTEAADATMKEASAYTQHTLFLLKCWVMLLELCVFVARFASCGKEYALAQYKERLLRSRNAFSPLPLAAVA